MSASLASHGRLLIVLLAGSCQEGFEVDPGSLCGLMSVTGLRVTEVTIGGTGNVLHSVESLQYNEGVPILAWS